MPEALPHGLGAAPEFVAALADDLNTPQALALLHETAALLRKDPSPERKREFLAAAELLGLLADTPQSWRQRLPATGEETLSEARIEALLAERTAARRARDFARADAIRDELKRAGIQIEDTPSGTVWRRALA